MIDINSIPLPSDAIIIPATSAPTPDLGNIVPDDSTKCTINLADELPAGDCTVFVDADIPVFKVAAVTDGACYNYNGEIFKYKKQALGARALRDAKAEEDGDNEYVSGPITSVFNPEPANVAIKALKGALSSFEKKVPGATFIYCLSSKSNFRYSIFPDYKIKRKGKRIPENRSVLNEWIVSDRDGISIDGYEADDTLGLMQGACVGGVMIPVICSVDKDLDCIPGWHINPDKNKVYEVSEFEAFHNFCCQVLKGDPTDSIPGLKGVGDKTAIKHLENIDTMHGLWGKVEGLYSEEGEGYLHKMASMVWIAREHGKTYHDYIDGGFENGVS